MHGNQIPFGEREGILFRAYEVENGLRCSCVCPGCKQPLNAANQGEKVSPYFRHAQAVDCTSGFKEGVRRAAVALIAEKMELTLPAFEGKASATTASGRTLTRSVLLKPKIATAESVLRFVDLGGVRAHAVLKNSGRQLLVRIKLSPRSELERNKRLRDINHSSIEIDLHALSLEQINSPTDFEYSVLHDPDNRSWIRSIRAERIQLHTELELLSEVQALDAQWAAEEFERERAEISRQRALKERQAARALALAAHRNTQRETAAQNSAENAQCVDSSNALEQRKNLIMATRLKAARDWANEGVECSACYLLSPPGTQFCLYCPSDSSEMIAVTIAADVARTIHHQMRSSVKPVRSISAVPALIVVPKP